MLTLFLLTALRTFLKNTIAYAKYKAGDEYSQAAIQSAELMEDGRIAITLLIDYVETEDMTVTEVQLYDQYGNILVSKDADIALNTAAEGILYRFTFTITES